MTVGAAIAKTGYAIAKAYFSRSRGLSPPSQESRSRTVSSFVEEADGIAHRAFLFLLSQIVHVLVLPAVVVARAVLVARTIRGWF